MKFLLETSIASFNRYSFQPDFTYFSREQNLMGDINPSIFQFHRAILYAPAYDDRDKRNFTWNDPLMKKKKKKKILIVFATWKNFYITSEIWKIISKNHISILLSR